MKGAPEPDPAAARQRPSLLRGPLPLERETCLFILASALDVFMTYLLLRSGEFIEGNPVARYYIDRWGVKGMVGFKFTMVAAVCVTSQLIARKRVRTARRVLLFATVVVSLVVLYSFALYVRAGAP